MKEATELSISVRQFAKNKDVVSNGNLPAFLVIALGNFSQAVLKACEDAGMLVDISMEISSESSCKGPDDHHD
ncbi:MAG: hypothetical protein M0R80_01085 [Proteobacteria bacterium]|nr:hypothetical protein [Pseudomonadota bacterium]